MTLKHRKKQHTEAKFAIKQKIDENFDATVEVRAQIVDVNAAI